ncbi:Solute carrier family 28 member 3, partial [Orchesella cincta]
MPPSKDEFLERKIMCLEKRLTLVERFMELRFCESIRDFSIRNEDDHDSPPPSGTSKRKKISKARCTPEPSPPPPAVKKIPGRRGRPPKAIKAVEARDRSPSDRSTPRKALKNSVQNRPGPSSVKRKALEKADADAAKVGKRGDENMED